MIKPPETREEFIAYWLFGGIVLTIIIMTHDTVKLLMMGSKRKRYPTGDNHGKI